VYSTNLYCSFKEGGTSTVCTVAIIEALESWSSYKGVYYGAVKPACHIINFQYQVHTTLSPAAIWHSHLTPWLLRDSFGRIINSAVTTLPAMGTPQSENSEAKQGNEDVGGKGELVADPLPADVLCGKSRGCMSHEGTRLFRIAIEQNRDKYQNAKTKLDRMDLTKEIVASFEGKGAQFLKFNSNVKCWEVCCSHLPLTLARCCLAIKIMVSHPCPRRWPFYPRRILERQLLETKYPMHSEVVT
jgi:hypothetical protein